MRASKDPTSQANYDQIRVFNSSYELDVNFDKKVLEGYALLEARVEREGTRELVLDTRDLTIHGVTDASGKALQYSVGDRHKVLGSALKVDLPPDLQSGQTVSVGVRFSTSPSSSAIQFLEPSQTAGGKHPYLFTQCQAIHARSLVPCQDSPGAKMSYSAVVRVPQPLTALMSAVPDSPPAAPPALPHLGDVAPQGPAHCFAFTQKVPIPPYLLALAVGELESRELSPRSRVWSEPSMVEAGAYEFAETSKFLDAGEAIAGEYVWGRYDLLLLPPSFPYGGMENPCLTFVTPTLLAGDRSLTNVVAHEIAHSWTGNLVTNASWEHFWLNEGCTVLLERKILGRLHGRRTLEFHAAAGALNLADTIKGLGEQHPHTLLVPDLSSGVDPDDVFSKVPYEKGFWFLYYLQELVGGKAVFDPFFRDYLAAFRFSTVTSDQFKELFMERFKHVPAVQQIDWDTWFYAHGMPPVNNSYDISLAQQAYDLALKWHTCDVMGVGTGSGPEGSSASDLSGWSSEQVVTFLDKLYEYRSLTPLHKNTARRMAELYNMYAFKNCEIRFSWYRLAITAEDETVLPHVVALLKEQGRMKYLRPLYRALYRSKMGRETALSTFTAAKASYHPIAQKMLSVDLGL